MNKYEKKLERIRQHLDNHPGDYQSVVSFYIAKSNAIEYGIRESRNRGMAEIARIRRQKV